MPENKAFYSRYGSSCNEHNETIYIYATRPGSIYDPALLEREDQHAVRTIAELEALLAELKAHRQAVAERYQELATAPTAPVVRLERKEQLAGIRYYLTTYRQYLDGGRVVVDRTTYHGKERHKAIAAFKEIVRSHPGIIAEKAI